MLTNPQPANEDADSAPNWLPGGVWGGWGVSEAVEGFVTSLPRMSGAPQRSTPRRFGPLGWQIMRKLIGVTLRNLRLSRSRSLTALADTRPPGTHHASIRICNRDCQTAPSPTGAALGECVAAHINCLLPSRRVVMDRSISLSLFVCLCLLCVKISTTEAQSWH